MMYYVLRIITTLVLMITFVMLASKLLVKKSKTVFIISVVIFVLIMIFIWSIKIDRIIMRFDTYEEAFRYEYPDSEIVKQYVGDYYYFAFYKSSGDYGMTSYIRKNDGWKLDDFFEHSEWTIKNYNGYTVFTNTLTDKEYIMVCVVYPEVISKDSNVKDSLNSMFEQLKFKNSGTWENSLECALINQKLDKNYYISINDEKHYVFR